MSKFYLFVLLCFFYSHSISSYVLPETEYGTFGFCSRPPNEPQEIPKLNLQISSQEVESPTPSYCYRMDKTFSPIFSLCMYPPEEDLISRYINESGMWELTKTKMLSIFFKEQKEKPNPRTLMLDLGANQGYFGFIAASYGYKVIMVEPGKYTADLLRQTILTNNWQKQVTVFRNAVYNKRQELTFIFTRGNSGSSLVVQSGPGEPINCIMPDDLLASLKFDPRQIFMLKIDVEGLDFHVLDGSRHIIKYGRPPVIMVEAPSNRVCNYTMAVEVLYQIGYVGINDLNLAKKYTFEEMVEAIENRMLPDLIFIDGEKHQEMAGHVTDTYNHQFSPV